MGSWNTSIKGNDTTLDVYGRFFELYNNGADPNDVSEQVKEEFRAYFEDQDDRNNSLFGLALAQWETKCLDPGSLEAVRVIVDSGEDLRLWSALGASEETVASRGEELQEFLGQLSTEKPRAKRRTRPRFKFSVNELLNEVAPDDKKAFRVSEEFVNDEYKHTSGILSWRSGVGFGISYFKGQGKLISARWLDKGTLEITHPAGIDFTKSVERVSPSGDTVTIEYREA